MKTITTNLYTFEELTEQAKQHAWMNDEHDVSDFHSGEFRATLDEFAKRFDIRVYNWSVGANCPASFSFRVEWPANDAPEGDALRLARYVWNNYSRHIMRGKYYSTGHRLENGAYTYKHRHSRIIREMENCPLTGAYCDGDILRPVIDCLHYKRMFSSYEDMVKACLESFFDAWQKDMEYCESFEYFAETANTNEWYFYENGDFYGCL